jgi:hypothetical protein
MVMVLSDTEAVCEGVATVVGSSVVTAGDEVAVALVGVTVGRAGGDSEHPQERMSRRVMISGTRIGFIDAGRSFPYNKVMAHLIAGVPLTFMMQPDNPVPYGADG